MFSLPWPSEKKTGICFGYRGTEIRCCQSKGIYIHALSKKNHGLSFEDRRNLGTLFCSEKNQKSLQARVSIKKFPSSKSETSSPLDLWYVLFQYFPPKNKSGYIPTLPSAKAAGCWEAGRRSCYQENFLPDREVEEGSPGQINLEEDPINGYQVLLLNSRKTLSLTEKQ